MEHLKNKERRRTEVAWLMDRFSNYVGPLGDTLLGRLGIVVLTLLVGIAGTVLLLATQGFPSTSPLALLGYFIISYALALIAVLNISLLYIHFTFISSTLWEAYYDHTAIKEGRYRYHKPVLWASLVYAVASLVCAVGVFAYIQPDIVGKDITSTIVGVLIGSVISLGALSMFSVALSLIGIVLYHVFYIFPMWIIHGDKD